MHTTVYPFLSHCCRTPPPPICPQAGSSLPTEKHSLNKQQERQQPPQNHTGSSTSSAHSTAKTTSGPEAIPQHELKALQAFLRKVYNWRGWQGGPYHITEAWHAVEAAAVTSAGGGWQQQFTGTQLTDANCDALLRVIDVQFCKGKLLRRLKGSRVPCGEAGSDPAAASCVACSAEDTTQQEVQGAQFDFDLSVGGGVSAAEASAGLSTGAAGAHTAAVPTPAKSKLRCRVVQRYDAPWLAYFDTLDNAIYINCWRWAKAVSADAPINCEGVVCVSRLQLLMHTLAHEMVHAVVFHLFPEMDSSSPAYIINNRHGPIFQLLNKQLFGHSSDALENVHLMSCSRV